MLESLDVTTFNEIVESLNTNDRWRSLAVSLRSFRVRIEFKDVQLQRWAKLESPATELLQELKNRCCPVIILKEILREANLLDTLAIISDPEPLTIVEQPVGDVDCRRHQESGEKCQHIHQSTELVLHCRATGMPPPEYQWFRSDPKIQMVPLDGQNGPTLTVDNFTLEHEGEYLCRVSQRTRDGTVESVESDSVVCKVIHTLPKMGRIVMIEQGTALCQSERIIEPGKPLVIVVEVKCDPPYSLQWHKDNVVLNGENSQKLEISKVSCEDSGKYFCSASNEAGEVYSSGIEVRVEYPHPRPTSKVALLIGNSIYDEYEDLMTSSNDILLLADHLRKVDFEVIALVNLSSEEMHRAIDSFFELLSPGSYAVFCFVGHGFHYNKRDYMMPVDCNCADDELLLDSAKFICDDIVEEKAIQVGLGLFVMIADMCRTKQRCSFKAENDNQEEQVDSDTDSTRPHIIRLYSTSENQRAYEVNGRPNGVYIPNLCEHIFQDKPIYDAVGDAIRNFQKHPLARKQTPAMKAQGINSMKLTDAAVQKVPIILKPYLKNLSTDLNLQFPLCISPHRGYICNAVDVTFRRPQKPFNINFELPAEMTIVELPTGNDNRGITIFNIQKTKGDFTVKVCLSDGTTTEPKQLSLQLYATLWGPARDKIFVN